MVFLGVYKVDEQSYWIDEGYTFKCSYFNTRKRLPNLDSGEVTAAPFEYLPYSRSVKLGA